MKTNILAAVLAAHTQAAAMQPGPLPTHSPTPTQNSLVHKTVTPNDSGGHLVPIVSFHRVIDSPTMYTDMTPLKMREILSYFHTHNFVLTPLQDVVEKNIRIPSGKKPLVLTADDYLINDGFVCQYIGYTQLHPDFGRAATLFVSSPDKNFGLKKKNLHDILRRYAALNIDVQPHGTKHAYLDDATLDEVKQEVLPITENLAKLCLMPRYYAFAGGDVPKSKEAFDMMHNGFSALLLCKGGLHSLRRTSKLMNRVDATQFEYLKLLLKENKKRLYVQP